MEICADVSAVVLAAGNSTRMRPLTDDRPKPMLDLAGKPVMEYVLHTLKKGGIEQVTITTHYLPQVIMDHFGDGSRLGMKISYAHEQDLMDTAGSLALLRDQVTEDVLICSGHFVLPSLNVQDLINIHRREGVAGTIAFKHLNQPDLLGLFGQGVLDERHRLAKFQEKPKQPISDLVHTTYQVYRRDVLDLLPIGRAVSIPEFLIPEMLTTGYPVHGYITDSELLNVSTPDLYQRAQRLANQGVLKYVN